MDKNGQRVACKNWNVYSPQRQNNLIFFWLPYSGLGKAVAAIYPERERPFTLLICMIINYLIYLKIGYLNSSHIMIVTCRNILKVSYNAISSFPFSLWSVTSWLCIDKIPEVAKTKVSKPKRCSLSLPRPLKWLIQTRPHMYTSGCGNIWIRRGFSNCSNVRSSRVRERLCVSRRKQKHFIWPSQSRCI